ncbi:MAG TPA: hypothetical protein VLL05_17285 [Terriglobales bacterium]|nr:hypothetical protein [Terriglobales bacterium]
MQTSVETSNTRENWPPELGEIVIFNSSSGQKSGLLREIRWGLVWRDFVLEDGRVIPEHKAVGCPESPNWRSTNEVSQEEREAWEERLVSMAESGVDPRDREQAFWAELNQYLAYIYLKFQPAEQRTDTAAR